MKPVTAVAISGGIDSLVAAYLLREKGHRIIGIHFITGFENHPCDRNPDGPLSPGGPLSDDPAGTRNSNHPVREVADQLGIPMEILDCREVFKKNIVDYFSRTYMDGCTPNPCLVCNRFIKFGTVLDFARDLGASHLATGHYIKKSLDAAGNEHLLKGDDPEKDQSYFLAFLSREQIASAMFPLGGLTKEAVKTLAKTKGLKPVYRKESQDVCFIREGTYSGFLRQQGILQNPGTIEDSRGNMLGTHKGLHHFTIGQRRGINCPAPFPYYVLRLDTDRNRLIVGPKEDLFSDRCQVTGINWIIQPPPAEIRVFTKIRYSHPGALSTLVPLNDYSAAIQFDEKQLAITPGQGAVFYREDEVIGGGWITKP